MKHAYSETRAEQLIPLLKSIAAEIDERTMNVRRLERQMRSFGENPSSGEALSVRAELAEQRRQLRLARTELEDLGCSSDSADPRRVLIPGIGGDLTQGFRWDIGDAHVSSLSESASPAA